MKSNNILTFLLVASISYLFYLIMSPFFIPIFWAIIFTILFYPYYSWLLRRVTKYELLASFLACLTVALFLIIPMALIASVMATEVFTLYQTAEGYISGISSGGLSIPPGIERFLSRYIDMSKVDLQGIIAGSIKDVASFAAEGVKGFIKNFAEFFFNLFLAFFAMYFLFKDGHKVINMVKNLLPLTKSDKEKVFDKSRAVISAAINGGVIVGVAQGALEGLAFWAIGISAPIFWGFSTFLLSFIPGIGTALIWVPAVTYLFIIGSTTKAIMLLVWSALVVSIIDNMLRPMIVSGKTDIHPLLLFFSILGAVNVFGLIGIIAGPLIVSVGLAALEIYLEAAKGKA